MTPFIIGPRCLGYKDNVKEILCLKSFAGVKFDL